MSYRTRSPSSPCTSFCDLSRSCRSLHRLSLGDVSLLSEDKLSLNQRNKDLLCHGTTTQNVSEDPINACCLCCSWNDTSLCCEHMNALPFDGSGEQFIVQEEHGNGTRSETARQKLAFTQN